MKQPQTESQGSWISWALGPIVFLIILLSDGFGWLEPDLAAVTAMTTWMMIWWISEAVPLYVTALIPMVLLPLLNIFEISRATSFYAHPIIFLFMGGFVIALAMERHNLHRRIALTIIYYTGTNANRIILGFMLATCLISMWISNTATTLMMLPIALSVLKLLDQQEGGDGLPHTFSVALLLGIAYAANIGGTMTIIGTPPTVVFVGYMQEFYGISMDFATWLLLGIPLGAVMLTLAYLLLTRVLYRSVTQGSLSGREVIRKELDALGPISHAEKMVLAVFLFTAVNWILRQPFSRLLVSAGWFEADRVATYYTDTTIAMAGALLMFTMPLRWNPPRYILEWDYTRNLPWGILLLFGGGMAMAKGLESVGVLELLKSYFESSPGISHTVLLVSLTAISLFLTEIMSNLALVTVLLPAVFTIATGLGASPILFGIPVTLAASYAFMMPVSTPPNAIVFASGNLHVKQMVRAGIWLNIIGIGLLYLAAETLIRYIYGV